MTAKLYHALSWRLPHGLLARSWGWCCLGLWECCHHRPVGNVQVAVHYTLEITLGDPRHFIEASVNQVWFAVIDCIMCKYVGAITRAVEIVRVLPPQFQANLLEFPILHGFFLQPFNLC